MEANAKERLSLCKVGMLSRKFFVAQGLDKDNNLERHACASSTSPQVPSCNPLNELLSKDSDSHMAISNL